MRSLLMMTVVVATVSIFGTWSVTALNIFSDTAARINPAIAAQRDFERSVADYRKCLADNPTDQNACKGLL